MFNFFKEKYYNKNNSEPYIAKSYAGIGNRIGGYVQLRLKNPKAKLYWPVSSFMKEIPDYLTFDEMFEPVDFLTMENNLHESCYYDGWDFEIDYLPSKTSLNNLHLVKKKSIDEIFPIINEFKIKDSLKKYILPKKYGIHIRTWDDNRPENRDKSADIILDSLKEVNLNETYICCDNLKIRKWLCDKDMLNHTLEPTQDSLIDMYSLAQCEKMFVTSGSTFSNIAWWLGKGKADVSYLPLNIEDLNQTYFKDLK